ncbi:MAG: cobalamin B12-binding domain-containing protein, partial [Bacteroidota bacterium]
MKLLLTHGYFLYEDPKEQQIMRPYPPLGILYISAYLKARNVPTEVYDTTFSSKADFQAYLLKHKPEFIGIYTNLMTKLNVLETIQFIRSQPEIKNMRIILGGPEVRYHDEQFLRHGADYIVIGEGETTMYDLISTVGNAFNPFLDQVDGIAFINARDEIVRTKERAKLRDVDELPFPDRKAIDLAKYFAVWKEHHG